MILPFKHCKFCSNSDTQNKVVSNRCKTCPPPLLPRNLSYTQISTMPYSRSLEGWLSVLDLRGTPNLHTFIGHKNGGKLRGQSFVFLSDVLFNYHAHCCRLKRSNYSYYELNFGFGRRRETSSQWFIFQKLYDYIFDKPHSSQLQTMASSDQPKLRHTRQTD